MTTAVVSAANMLTSILLARHAGPAVLGEFVVLMAWAHAAFALLSPGFDQAYIRDSSAPGRWSSAVWLTLSQMVAILLLPLLVVVLVRSLWPSMAGALSLTGLCVLLGAIALGVAGNLVLSLLAAQLRYRRVNIVRLGSALGASAACLAWSFGQAEPDLWPFFVRELAVGGLTLLLALPMARGLWPAWVAPTKAALRDMLAFARDLWGLNALEKLVQRVEYLVLAAVVPLPQVGSFYAVRALFDGVHGMLMVPVQTVLFAFMSRGQGVNALLTLLTPSWRLLHAVLLATAAAGLMGLLAPLFPLILGARYQTSAALPIAFAALVFLLSYFELVKVTLMSQGQHRALIVGRLVQIALLGLATPLLAAWAGTSGAAFAPVLAALVLCGVAGHVLRRQMQHR